MRFFYSLKRDCRYFINFILTSRKDLCSLGILGMLKFLRNLYNRLVWPDLLFRRDRKIAKIDY